MNLVKNEVLSYCSLSSFMAQSGHTEETANSKNPQATSKNQFF